MLFSHLSSSIKLCESDRNILSSGKTVRTASISNSNLSKRSPLSEVGRQLKSWNGSDSDPWLLISGQLHFFWSSPVLSVCFYIVSATSLWYYITHLTVWKPLKWNEQLDTTNTHWYNSPLRTRVCLGQPYIFSQVFCNILQPSSPWSSTWCRPIRFWKWLFLTSLSSLIRWMTPNHLIFLILIA